MNIINSLQLGERYKGPRTLYLDFIKNVKEMRCVEIGLQKFKCMSLNFITNLERIIQYDRNLTISLFLFYRESDHFKEFSESLIKNHLNNNFIFSSNLIEIEKIN